MDFSKVKFVSIVYSDSKKLNFHYNRQDVTLIHLAFEQRCQTHILSAQCAKVDIACRNMVKEAFRFASA